MPNFKLTYQVGETQDLQYFDDIISLEEAYFRLSRERHDGPSAIRFTEQAGGAVPPAYYRLDKDWQGDREQFAERMHLWSDNPGEFKQPLPTQIRALGRLIGGRSLVGMSIGIGPRRFAYYAQTEDKKDFRKMSFIMWRALLQRAGVAGALLPADKMGVIT